MLCLLQTLFDGLVEVGGIDVCVFREHLLILVELVVLYSELQILFSNVIRVVRQRDHSVR